MLRVVLVLGLAAASLVVAGAIRPDLPIAGALARALRPTDPLAQGADGGAAKSAWDATLGSLLAPAASENEAPPGPSVLYRFVDDAGVLRIVDSIEQVPEQHRATARRLDASPDRPAFHNTYAAPKPKPRPKPARIRLEDE